MAPKKPNSVQKVSKENQRFLRGPAGPTEKWLRGESSTVKNRNPFDTGSTGDDGPAQLVARGKEAAAATDAARLARQAQIAPDRE